jgi:hypothetical protein
MSTRNNQDRLGARDMHQDAPNLPTQEPEIHNEPDPSSRPMSFATPTEFVELPSKGMYYGEDHPLHGCDSVEIRFMTAKEEDILTSKTLLKKGLVIDRLLSNVLVDKKINPEDLLIGDKNALVIATRISGYGSDYTTRINCPSCGSTEQQSFNLEEASVHHGIDDGEKYVSRTDQGTFVVNTPRTKVDVEIRLLTGHDEKKLVRAEEKRKKHKLPESLATTSLNAFIVSVNGDNDPSYIRSFIDNTPAADSRYLREAHKTVTPNVDLIFDFSCSACDHEQPLEVPFTADFFWPK